MNEYFQIERYWDTDSYALQRIYQIVDNDIFNVDHHYFFSGTDYFNINYLDVYDSLTLHGKELIRRLSIIPGLLDFYIHKTLPPELNSSQNSGNCENSVYLVINRYPHFKWDNINININYLIRDDNMLLFRHTLAYENRNNIELNKCFYKRHSIDSISFYTYKNLLKKFTHSVHRIKYRNNGSLQFVNYEPSSYIRENECFLTRQMRSFLKYTLTNYITQDMFSNVSCFRHVIRFTYSREINNQHIFDIFDFISRSLISKFHFYQIEELPPFIS